MAAEYPAAYTANPQSTADDDPANALIANGADYNKHDEEIAALSGDLISAFGVSGAATITALITAMLGGHTDGNKFFSPHVWQPFNAGNWTRDTAIVERVPANGSDTISVALELDSRAAAGRGIKITSIDVVYAVAVAILNVDLTMLVGLTTLNGDTNAPTTAPVAGAFDAAHDTAAERNAIQEHTITFTPTAPIFVAAGTGTFVDITVDDTGGGTSEVSITGCDVHYEWVMLDGV